MIGTVACSDCGEMMIGNARPSVCFDCEKKRHEDATRDDPPGGASREEWIKARLKKYLRDPVIYRMVDRGETVTGREISREIVDYCDIRACLTLERLDRQSIILLLAQYGPWNRTLEEAARIVGIPLSEAYRTRHFALEAIIRRYYDEPDYILPWRSQVRTDAREAIAARLRDLGV